jgi:hypothetical protein
MHNISFPSPLIQMIAAFYQIKEDYLELLSIKVQKTKKKMCYFYFQVLTKPDISIII